MLDDSLLCVILLLLMLFALFYATNYPAFAKMTVDAVSTKERQSIFEEQAHVGWGLKVFMIFQFLLLCSIFLVRASEAYHYIQVYTVTDLFKWLVYGFLAVSAFYLFKRMCNFVIWNIFAPRDEYKLWSTGYTATMSAWGTLLYIPVMLLILAGHYPLLSLIVFALFFLVNRIVIIYKTTNIFRIKRIHLFHFLLYLCGLELMTFLLFLKGLSFFYNLLE